jgi:hypothetical protein
MVPKLENAQFRMLRRPSHSVRDTCRHALRHPWQTLKDLVLLDRQFRHVERISDTEKGVFTNLVIANIEAASIMGGDPKLRAALDSKLEEICANESQLRSEYAKMNKHYKASVWTVAITCAIGLANLALSYFEVALPPVVRAIASYLSLPPIAAVALLLRTHIKRKHVKETLFEIEVTKEFAREMQSGE